MAIANGDGYTVDVHVQNIKLSELNKYKIKSSSTSSDNDELKDIQVIDIRDLSYYKDDSILELNRLVTNYTGTLFTDKYNNLDYNKLLPSDLELFSTNVTTSEDDNRNDSQYNEYNRVVYINDGNNDILKIQLNSYKLLANEDYVESIVELYKENTLVVTIKYDSEPINRSHVIILSSQYDTDEISCKVHEAEDNVEEVQSQGNPEDKYFSTGKGIIHNKVSDCNISYIVSDSVKNVLSKSSIEGINNLKSCEFNSMILTNRNKKIFLGIPN